MRWGPSGAVDAGASGAFAAVDGSLWIGREGWLGIARLAAMWRDLPEQLGKGNSMSKRFACRAGDGSWETCSQRRKKQSDMSGNLDWVVSIDSDIRGMSGVTTKSTAPAVG